jgi:hypothetical protein
LKDGAGKKKQVVERYSSHKIEILSYKTNKKFITNSMLKDEIKNKSTRKSKKKKRFDSTCIYLLNSQPRPSDQDKLIEKN